MLSSSSSEASIADIPVGVGIVPAASFADGPASPDFGVTLLLDAGVMDADDVDKGDDARCDLRRHMSSCCCRVT